jgi:pimeloyl-ACP methyl ester carboxylesterase
MVQPLGRKGTVCLFQGRSDFIEKYFETVRDLRARGFAVATSDWRGQGMSDRALHDRRKGYVRSFSEYQIDLDCFIREIVLPDCPSPIFALAHAMGATVLLRAADNGRHGRLSPILQHSAGRSPDLRRNIRPGKHEQENQNGIDRDGDNIRRRISCPLIHPIGHDVPLALGAPRSFSAICLSRSFSIVLAQAEALAATACCLNALLELSTAKPQSTAGCCLKADCPMLTSSIILARSI